ncbi:MAG: hypothetical protein AB7U41_03865 [Dongiaceae bacterium]
MKKHFSPFAKAAGAFAAAALSGCAAPRINHSALLTPLEPAPVKVETPPPLPPSPPSAASPKPIRYEAVDAGKLLPAPPPNILIYYVGPGYGISIASGKPFLPPYQVLPPGTLFYLPDHIPYPCPDDNSQEDSTLGRIVWLLSPTFDGIEEHAGIRAGGQSGGAPPNQTSFQGRIVSLTIEQKLLALEKHLSFLRIMADSSLELPQAEIKWRNALLASVQRAITVREVDHMTLHVTWENIGAAMAPSAARHALKKWEEIKEKLKRESALHLPPAQEQEKDGEKDPPFLAAFPLPAPQPRLEEVFNPKLKER